MVALDLTAPNKGLPTYDAEEDFNYRTNTVNSRYANLDRITNRILLLRDGQLPIAGDTAAAAYLNPQERNWLWMP